MVTAFANTPMQVNILSKQYFPTGMALSGSSLPTVNEVTALKTLSLTFNPLTKTVSLK